ncbi:nucleotide-binding protein [Sulfurimonas sp.]|uniref:nucleotide-binding protein n=1 Tax=Sulfurimonas sp. TaxID=2022749 RepID=UPI002B4AA528|nr:nucleotide-binding protein [Sulfurimonas sp.]
MNFELLHNDYEKIEYLYNILIDRATGGSVNEEEYKLLRSELLNNKSLTNFMPSWLRTNRNLDSFWGFIKPKFDSYAERRTFLTNEFSQILDHLEFGTELNNHKKDMYLKEEITEDQKVLKNKVFIVHGHDNETKQEVARFVQNLGLEAIILHEQVSSGMTIIEKIEHYTNEADFAIVLYTPCDKGRGATETKVHPRDRARQNVVFEHGYLMAQLGRKHVCALVKGDIETPSDISGVVYTDMDISGAWKISITKELNACGYNVSSII